MPKAARIITRSTFEPDVMKAVAEVFEAEWAAIRPAFSGWRRPAVEAARLSVAKVTIHLAGQGFTEPQALRRKLHTVMKNSHAALADHQP